MNAYIEIFLIFILPILLWHFKLVSSKYRGVALTVITFAAVFFVYIDKLQPATLGFRFDNFLSALPFYLICTAVGVVFLIFTAKILQRKTVENWQQDSRFIFAFSLGSIMQEFLYRSFLMPKLMQISHSAILIILLNALLFSLIHVIYPQAKINLPIIFLAGIFFAAIYFYYPNFYLIAASHMLLNFIALRFDFFTLQKSYLRT